jgi:hypothetical protein
MGSHDLFQDVVGFRCPDKWFGLSVAFGNVLIDRTDQFWDAGERASA